MQRFHHHRVSTAQKPRRGAIFVLAAAALILIFGFTAFSVDVGFITLTKGQLQNTSDAGALAGLIELSDGLGPGSTLTDAQIEAAAGAAAVATVAANRAGERNSVYADQARDVRIGNYSFDSGTGAWVKQWGVSPYNMIEVTLHRDQPASTLGDGPLDLYFAPVMGTDTATMSVTSTAVLQPGGGIGGPSSSGDNDGFIGVLPITLDIETWTDLMNRDFSNGRLLGDNFTYNEATGQITSGSDGILEVNLYPEEYGPNPSNRGTVDFGHSGNSTADISRQILHGLSEEDLEPFGGRLVFSDWPNNEIVVNGDTGLSAGIKDELDSIKGLSRVIPIFVRTNDGHGNNLDYYIVKFVGIRIMYVKLTGKPTSKRVVIQPAPFTADEVIPGEITVTDDTIFTPGALID